MTVRLAAQESTLPGDTLMAKFSFALDCGFDGIELGGAGNGVFAGRAAELREAREAGVVMSSAVMHTEVFLGDFDADRRRRAVEELRGLLTTVAEAGGRGVVCPNAYAVFSRSLPPYTPPRPQEESRAALVEALVELGAHADSVGVQVLLEPLNRYEDYLVNTLADAVSIAAEVESPGVGVVADTYHMSIEEADCAASIRSAGDRIRHVQLGDSNRLEPGAGHYDWPGTLATLESIGYDGWLAMECRLSGPAGEVLPRVAALLRS